MRADFLFMAATVIANLGLGFFVIAQKPRTKQNFLFALISVSITSWIASSYFTDHAATLHSKLWFAYFAFGFAYLSITSLYWFSYIFKNKHTNSDIQIGTLRIVVGVVGTILATTPLVVASVHPRDGYTNISPGLLFIPYLVALATVFVLFAKNLLLAARKSANPKTKYQARVMVAGSTISFILILATNAIVPAIVGSWALASWGPPMTVFIVASIAYSIIRHQLFDIKSAATRAVAYLLSVGVLIVFFVAFMYVATSLIFKDLSFTKTQSFFLIGAMVFTALIFGTLKHFFDHLTANIFFKRPYESEEVISNLNRALIEEIEPSRVLPEISKELTTGMKLDFVVFAIKGKENLRLYSSESPTFSNVDIQFLETYEQDQIITYDLFETDRKLYEQLNSHNIAVIRRLQTSTDKIGWLIFGDKKNGELFTRGDVEVTSIVASECAIAIENSLRFEEIEQFNVTLQDKVNTATAELRETNEKLKALDEAKDEFISMASHQLRTPLTSIKGYLSMVLDGDVGDVSDQQKEYINQAFSSSQRMVYLISDLLNVSRIHTGKFKIERTQVKFPELVQAEVDQLRESAKARKIDFQYEAPADFPEVSADETKTHQVVMNLMDNALYYTPPGGKVVVTLEHDDKNVIFKVKDSGIGVPKEAQGHLFTKFYRADNAKEARPDGTGIGLFMCKKVVDAQGGSVVFESEAGKGSTFGFTLPLVPGPQATTEVPATEP